VESRRFSGAFEFLLDTGSSRSFISGPALRAQGLEPATLGRRRGSSRGVGGEVPTLRPDDSVDLFLADEFEQVCLFQDVSFEILESEDWVPCILGRDFMEAFRVRLVYDPDASSIRLERDSRAGSFVADEEDASTAGAAETAARGFIATDG
jgi:hypothetical protein